MSVAPLLRAGCFAATTLALAAAEPGLSELTRLDGLPRLRESVEVGAITSYDRTGGNDDGFSGTYSFVRKEGDALVLADLKGPGVITRIATPTPTDAPLEFYFDGETTPRLSLPFRKLFDGSTAPFLTPLVDRGHGGNWSYVPIPFAKSCKVVIRAPKVQFYQINYATFAEGTAIRTFDPAAVAASSELAQARDLIGRTGQDLSAWVVPAGTPLHTERKTVTVAPGQTVTLFESQQGGRIAGLRLGPTAALSGPDRGLVLQMTWDGATSPAVLCPAGDYFGFSWGRSSMRSLLVGTDRETCYSYFPMPYDGSARIELRSERPGGAPVEVTAEIVYADLPRRPDEGRFNATWRRENPTTSGQPFTFVDVKGRGHLVGVTFQSEGEKNGLTGFFEGDDHAFIDGKLAVNGTGSEDFFNGGWYDVPGQWETRTSHPLNGCLDYLRAIGRSGGYRLFLGDAYAFRQSLVVDIEHAPEKNTLVTDYAGV
ncbi:MAG TPA: glycoside hydrolase family 172 protein, partial [Opitutaceae bacterium]